MKLTTRVFCAFSFLSLGLAPGVALRAKQTAPAGVGASETVAAQEAVQTPQTELHAVLRRAIEERRMVNFSYGGFARVLEPHAYGVSMTGEVVLHGYQTAGGSSSVPPPGWRTFTVSGISDLVVTERRFAKPRADYSAERPRLEPLWAEVVARETSKSTTSP